LFTTSVKIDFLALFVIIRSTYGDVQDEPILGSFSHRDERFKMNIDKLRRWIAILGVLLSLTGLSACADEVSEKDINCLDLGEDNSEQYVCSIAKAILVPMMNVVLADDPSSLDGIHAVYIFGVGEEVECGAIPMSSDELLLAAWCYSDGYIGVDAVGVIENVANDNLDFIRASMLWALTTRIVEDTPLEDNAACKAGDISRRMVDAGSITPDESTAMRDSLFTDNLASYFETEDVAALSNAFDVGYDDVCLAA